MAQDETTKDTKSPEDLDPHIRGFVFFVGFVVGLCSCGPAGRAPQSERRCLIAEVHSDFDASGGSGGCRGAEEG